MARSKKDTVPLLVVSKNATMKQIYAAGRKHFTSAELQRFTESGEEVPPRENHCGIGSYSAPRVRQTTQEGMSMPEFPSGGLR